MMEALDEHTKELYFVCSTRFFWARQPQEHAYVTEMYNVMSRIQNGTLQAGNDQGWDVHIQGHLGESYWI